MLTMTRTLSVLDAEGIITSSERRGAVRQLPLGVVSARNRSRRTRQLNFSSRARFHLSDGRRRSARDRVAVFAYVMKD